LLNFLPLYLELNLIFYGFMQPNKKYGKIKMTYNFYCNKFLLKKQVEKPLLTFKNRSF